ncbi:CapA family protein [Robertkochia aurantiaca]|uniref:CapA family protein n=1 Tax=Robertkochia aurantiaca TaxID=2873700 RepID=UPI001CCC0981|nr:CapA family protein [Robertkochia sp. 3YJGBD-33]
MSDQLARILIGGDICPVGETSRYFINDRISDLFRELGPLMQEADHTVVNLECPLTDTSDPIAKNGPVLKAPAVCATGLRKAGIDAVNLANNHILDHAKSGLQNTLTVLQKEAIGFFGAGFSPGEADKAYFSIHGELKVAWYGVAEHEFNRDLRSGMGANALDVVENSRAIRKLSKEADHVIVLYHGGKEHYPFPTPDQQKISRFFIDEGASVVVAQHSHMAGSYENYEKGLIVYGQGNFLFERNKRNHPAWYEGFLIQLSLNKSGFAYEFIPFRQSDGFAGVKMMKEGESASFLRSLDERSKEVVDTEFVRDQWLKYCKTQRRNYTDRLMGHNRWLRALNRRIGFSDRLYGIDKVNMIRNVVHCETHREVLRALWEEEGLEDN